MTTDDRPDLLPFEQRLLTELTDAIRVRAADAPARHPRSRCHSRWTVLAIGAVAVAGTSAAAIAYAIHQPVTDKSSIRCYTDASSADTDLFTTVMRAQPANSAGPMPGDSTGPADIDDPQALCADLWRQGFLVAGKRVGLVRPDPSADNPVPPLVTCTLPDGTAAVFPGPSGTCARLQLPTATPPSQTGTAPS